ncbi:MAG TPA: SWIM zinc finger family protein [Microthrixaceae bacterium]|nr:SWIM zinc finger family protein [Microthrixaceae bacterium]
MPAKRRTFGNTWWGQAWLDALEGRAVHDPNRLPRGRTYARQSRADDLVIEPGRAKAWVQGSRPDPYEVLLQVRQFRDDEWECVLDAIAGKAAHAAALLDGELEPGIVADAETVEVDILPRSGDLRTACDCPDWAEPCKHAAAVCYLVADALDDDPFVVFLLRGMDRQTVIDAIRARRSSGDDAASASEAGDGAAVEGVVAREAWRREREPLPDVPAPPLDGPLAPAAWPSPPPGDAPFTAEGLERLIADAGRRAWALRLGVGADTSALELDERADLARHAAWLDETERRHLAARAGVTDAELELWATAWQAAGADGVRMLDEASWTPPVVEMVTAKERIEAAGTPKGTIQVRANRITIGPQQYRLGRDGRWYLFLKRGGRWMLASPGSDDLDEVIDLTTDLGPG